MDEHPIFTVDELMVLLSVSGGEALYGFWDEKKITRREILIAANRLLKRGVLTVSAEGELQPAAGAAELLRPLQRPEQVILLTPMAEDRPQVCFAFDACQGVGYESVLVQKDAVRLFPLERACWEKELESRELLQAMEGPVPKARRLESPVEAAFDLPVQQLAEQWTHVTALLEFYERGDRQPRKKVLLRDGPGEVRAIVITPEGGWSTNDPLCAVRLDSQQTKEDTP